jgi:hypothetical protein
MGVLHFSIQEEGIIELANAKCHMFTLTINLLTIVQPKHRSHNIIEQTNAKILVNTLTPSVRRLHY